TEIESLQLGAIDFIPKPYPPIGVIQARVLRTIELHEDRDIIQLTERDELTGLYNLEYFFRYAEQYDQYHQDKEMDAVILDINHFRMINERYGKSYGDAVLKRIAAGVKSILGETGGIVCRKGADTFLVYCQHRDDYRSLLDDASFTLTESKESGNRVRLRMGIYENVDKSIDIERRFDHAKMAADTVKGSFTQNIGYYDDNLHERELYAEQLIEDFPKAIAEGQFKVYFQPKFDVRPDTPVLASAEALVRWIHPDMGMISPGVFIPLFEENGLIQKLDTYVWRETARQIRDWKDRLHYSVPVSVNVSRVDVYDEDLADTLQDVLNEHGLSASDMLLELTESAYTQDSTQIVETAEKLRGMGFKIEMDDFGTGYSSLNMISSLPIDALKLDMQFIRDAFKEGGSTHLLEVIIGIADFLSVPVIAEGVETEQQLRTLKALGCDLVQGYFFSKPVPASDFEAFILQKKEAVAAEAERLFAQPEPEDSEDLKKKLLQAKMGDAHGAEPGSTEAEISAADGPREHTGIQLRTASVFSVILAIIAAAALLFADISVSKAYERMANASDRYISAQMAASDMESGSDYLTDRVRCFVVTGEVEYLKDFFEEIDDTRRRDRAVENLERLLEGTGSSALGNLNTALNLSNELVSIENLAMRLMVEAGHYHAEDIPQTIASISLGDEYKGLSAQELKEKAQTMVFDNNYMHYKDKIRENVGLCTQSLILSSSQELEQASSKLSLLVNIQTILTLLFLLIVLAIVGIVTQLVRKPLTNMVHKMQNQEIVPVAGVEELRFVTRTYNTIMEENRQAKERLSHEASHDALTGLFNRGAYDLLIESADTEHMALILLDMDGFKGINDTYGHAVGDRALKRVAELMKKSFRSVDILCRIGGDEFAIVMTRVNSSMRQLVLNKINHINDLLQHPTDDLPPLSLSVGVAFSDR
ncbi:MAG: EAL domain-containing protein, partial [Clostridia bacterium]|nr:EAL domain-containing protein [Clostridia bacterium]